jgi:hypothetical protein
VLVGGDGISRITDFGVARAASRLSATRVGQLKGKIAYMAPEQLLDRGVDRRSDVFSTGIVLWELLVGRSLFHRETDAATLYAIMNDPLRAPSRLRPGVPAELDRIVMRALSRTPADRFDTAEEMAEALEQFLASQPKTDGRAFAKLIEGLFGSTRADAKRAISQTRALAHNVALVMKLRTDAPGLEIGAGSTQGPATSMAMSRARSSLVAFWVMLLVVGIAAGVAYVVVTRGGGGDKAAPASARTSLEITSRPPGASITIGGEPTGLKTPATLTGLTVRDLDLRLELPDHKILTTRVSVPASGSATKHFELAHE